MRSGLKEFSETRDGFVWDFSMSLAIFTSESLKSEVSCIICKR